VNTIIGTSSNPAAFSRSFSASWLSRLRGIRGYELAVRALGSAWFLMLALLLVRKFLTHTETMRLADFGPNGWPALLSSVCLFQFYLAAWWFILVRRSSVARTDGVIPSLIAFAGTYLPWTIVLFTPAETSAGQNLASAALLLIGTALMVVVICHLGRSFSIVPQARILVRTGPYSVIRNPLYLAEEIAVVGILLQFYSIAAFLLLLVHCGLQVGRILYEENLLRQTFPDYDEYARTTSRLVPHVW
jgi:protein-S-isoprenylcysteine O-methyltransferase Ste14